MPSFANLMNLLLGYGTSAEDRSGRGYRRPSHTLAYGEHHLQALDLHLHPDGDARPLLAFLHGGAWQFGDKTRRLKDAKVPFAHGEGWHFASINTRLVPRATVAEMAEDLAAAMALLLVDGEAHGIDTARIVLMGHSAGAHLAALVATNPHLLDRHGHQPHAIAGLVLNDGAAYLATEPSTHNRFYQRRLMDPAFGGADLAALSPALLAGRPEKLPPALIFHGSAAPMAHQSQLLEAAWQDAGGEAQRHPFPGASIVHHMRLSRRFGREGFGPTEVARQWLRERFV